MYQRALLLCYLIIFCSSSLFAQQIVWKDTVGTQKAKDTTVRNFAHLYDISDGIKDIGRFIRHDTTTKIPKKRSGLSILPNINYNPSIGFQVGSKIVSGMYLGDRENTSMSTYATALNYTTRGIIFGYLMHDIY